MQAVKAFEKEAPEAALAKHPQLAGAHAALAVVEQQTQADGLDAKQQAIVLNAARGNIAKNLDTGKYPEVKIQEEIEVKREHSNER
jgi:hypothetical protein